MAPTPRSIIIVIIIISSSIIIIISSSSSSSMFISISYIIITISISIIIIISSSSSSSSSSNSTINPEAEEYVSVCLSSILLKSLDTLHEIQVYSNHLKTTQSHSISLNTSFAGSASP